MRAAVERVLVVALFAALVAVVGARALGTHWPSDIVGG